MIRAYFLLIRVSVGGFFNLSFNYNSFQVYWFFRIKKITIFNLVFVNENDNSYAC